MEGQSLKPGVKLGINNDVYTVIDGTRIDDVEIRSDASGHVYHVNLMNKLESGNTVSVVGSEQQGSALAQTGILSLSEARHDQARRRYLTILPLLQIPHRTAKDVEEVARKVGVSSRIVYRWIDRYERNGFKGLVTPESFGGKGKSRPKDDDWARAESILEELIETDYLTKNRMSRAELYRNFESLCRQAGIKQESILSERTVYRRLRIIDDRVATQRRFGDRAYQQKYGLRGGSFTDKEYPLQTIEIDHTKLDIIVVDDATGKVVGRPWLTLGMDAYSRTIWGYRFGLQEPNADTVGLVIITGCLKKDHILNAFGIPDGRWPVYGIPFQIQTDNGKDFRSKAFERGCEANGINLIRRPVRRPEYGGYIERFIRTLNSELIHNLPGSTLSDVNSRKKGDYDPEKQACLTMKDLERLIVDFIVNHYHNTIHDELQMTPNCKWRRGLEGKENSCPIVPREPEDIERFRQDFLTFVEPDGKRVIERDGIHYKDLVYYASELNVLARYENGKQKKYYIRFDPQDLRYVYIYDDKNDRYYRLSLKERPATAFTSRELGNARRQLREQGNRDPAEDIVMDTILRRRQCLAELVEDSKKARKIVESAKTERDTRKRLRIESSSVEQEQKMSCNDELTMKELASKIMLSLDDRDEENGDNDDDDERGNAS